MQLSFKSETPYYPLRFSSRQGVFDVNLYVLTKNEFDYEKSSESLKKLRFKEGEYLPNVEVIPSAFPKALRSAYEKSAFRKDEGKWHLNVLRGSSVNRDNAIAQWKEDVFFRTRA